MVLQSWFPVRFRRSGRLSFLRGELCNVERGVELCDVGWKCTNSGEFDGETRKKASLIKAIWLMGTPRETGGAQLLFLSSLLTRNPQFCGESSKVYIKLKALVGCVTTRQLACDLLHVLRCTARRVPSALPKAPED